MKPKFKLEDYKGKYAMHCPEQWQAERFCHFLCKSDRTWRNETSYLENSNWNIHKESTCYEFNVGRYGSKDYCCNMGFTILEFSDFDWSEMHKPLEHDISFGTPVYDLVYRPATQPTHDSVNHPSHYTDGKIEVIDFIEDKKLGFARGNAVKYICRAGKKNPDKEIEDLEKAIWYIQREIKMLGGAE